jgi:glycosyltransferase involved in cell wall biosynthesis
VRAALNAHFFHHPHTGSGQYLLSLLRAFAAAPELEALPSCDGAPAIPASGWPGRVAPAFVRTPFDRVGGDVRKVWWEQVTWPAAARAARAGVAHVPYFAPPLASRGVPVVATIHDLIPLILPAYVTSPLVRFYNRLVGAGARRAQHILVDSEASKRDVVRLLRIPPERVEVIYLAPDEAVLAPVSPERIEEARRKYGLEDPYVFYLGGLDSRKNVPALLRAVAALPPDVPWHLLVSGRLRRDNPRLFPDLPAIAEQLGITDRVLFAFVPDEDKAALYRGAACFAFPSIYEGAGLDPLEALACGTPVVASNRSSLPEYLGDAALLVDPDDEHAFSDALRRVFADADLRADLSRRGPPQAAKFSWDATARQTCAAYRRAAGRESGGGAPRTKRSPSPSEGEGAGG